MNFEAHIAGDTAWVDWIYVAPSERRKGLARQRYLLFERGLPPSVKQVRVMAADAGDGPSDEFWKVLGFDYAYPDAEDYEDRQIMIKQLVRQKSVKLVEAMLEGESARQFLLRMLRKARSKENRVNHNFDQYVQATQLDATRIGTGRYEGLAYFWAYAYRHYLRDATPAQRRAVHAAWLRLGLDLTGESDQHLQVIRQVTGRR